MPGPVSARETLLNLPSRTRLFRVSSSAEPDNLLRLTHGKQVGVYQYDRLSVIALSIMAAVFTVLIQAIQRALFTLKCPYCR